MRTLLNSLTTIQINSEHRKYTKVGALSLLGGESTYCSVFLEDLKAIEG